MNSNLPTWVNALRLLSLPVSLFVGPLALLLLFASITLQGRVVALGFFAAALLPLAWGWTRVREGVAVVVVSCAVLAQLGLPSSGADGRFSAHYPDAGTVERPASFWRLSPSTLVPEIDQFLMGTYLVPLADPFLDFAQAAEMRTVLREIYEPMRQDAEHRDTPSALGLCYWDMLFDTPQRHRFTYVPPVDEPVPVLLFLHGSLGNFKGYYHVLEPLADELGFAIVGPTNGLGNWRRAGAMHEIEAALEAIDQDPRFSGEVHLAGLSNGGPGVTRALGAFPGRFTTVTYLSPAVGMEALELDVPDRPPILMVTGDADRRVSWRYIEEVGRQFEARGHDVTMEIVPDEDHFLLFRSPESVRDPMRRHLSRGSDRLLAPGRLNTSGPLATG